jgi:tetraacyldisaccharide 4'-kinase
LQDADRVALAQIAVEELDSQVLVLDDGFQHRRLKRDLDVVLIDATDPWGHGYLFPRGLLREPAACLRRAGMVLLTRCDQADATARNEIRRKLSRLAPAAPVVETVHEPCDLVNSEKASAGLELVKKRRVAAFCGIGNPEAFRKTVLALDAELCDFRVFPDHHAYGRSDIEGLRSWAGAMPEDCLIATTQKDLVKIRLRILGGRALWAVRIRMGIEQGRELLDHELGHLVKDC